MVGANGGGDKYRCEEGGIRGRRGGGVNKVMSKSNHTYTQQEPLGIFNITRIVQLDRFLLRTRVGVMSFQSPSLCSN